MRTVVVTEGESDILLLKSLLGKTDASTEFVKSGGWSAADSLSRSYLIDGRHDVVLVVDADSYDPTAIRERKRFLEYSLSSVALRTRWEVIVVAPEIEVLLFKDRLLLEQLVKQPVSQAVFEQGKFEPNKILMRLLSGQSRSDFFQNRLPKFDLTPLRKQEEIVSLQRFLKGTARKVAA